MTDSTSSLPDDLTFGSALEELDQIVAALESGTLELEDSLLRYERGVSLLRGLQEKLSSAQQKVTMLIGEIESETADGATAGSATADTTSPGDTAEEVPF
jgi:exodeoxyribonuclease VII small subunit